MNILKTTIYLCGAMTLLACGQQPEESLETLEYELQIVGPISRTVIPGLESDANVCDTAAFDYCNLNMDAPDFDQVRKGELPGDGTMHCYPTTAANLLTWLSREGDLEDYAVFGTPNRIDTTELFCSGDTIPARVGRGTPTEFCENTRAWTEGISPEEFHGAHYSLYLAIDNLIYQSTSNLIEQLGYDMGTQGMSGPDDEADGSGTRLVDFISVLEERTEGSANVTTYMNSGCRQEIFGPRTISRLVESGGIGALSYGFYDDEDGDGFQTRVSGRGHMVTALGASKLGDVRKVYFHDSARSGKFGTVNQERQTTSFLETATVEPMRVNRKVFDADGVEIDSCSDILTWKINLPNGESAFLEGLVEVVPN